MTCTLCSLLDALTVPSALSHPTSEATARRLKSGTGGVCVPSCVDLAAASGYWASTLLMLREGAIRGLWRSRGEEPAAGTLCVLRMCVSVCTLCVEGGESPIRPPGAKD